MPPRGRESRLRARRCLLAATRLRSCSFSMIPPSPQITQKSVKMKTCNKINKLKQYISDKNSSITFGKNVPFPDHKTANNCPSCILWPIDPPLYLVLILSRSDRTDFVFPLYGIIYTDMIFISPIKSSQMQNRQMWI